MSIEKREDASRFILMEASDNAQIVAEINGEMLKEMVYSFKGKNRLSYAGAKFAAIQLGNIHVRESIVTYNKDLDQFEASALAFNENNNLTLPGYAEQSRHMKVWDNKEKNESHLEVDEFARRKAASKAVRNALMAVMPADHIAAYMRAAIDKGKVRMIKNVEVDQKPPTEKPKAKVGDPPRPRKKTIEKPPEPEIVEAPRPPESKEQVEEYLGTSIIGLEDYVKVGEYDDNFRVVRRKTLDTEIESQINGLVERMGGSFDYNNNYWVIPR